MILSGDITAADAQPSQSWTLSRTVVLDPGHGGGEAGARGPEGTLEKEITLRLARLIAKQLENKYRVMLTRTDDYGVDLPSRTATANHFTADLFISIHTGGSFLHNVRGVNVFYFQSVLDPDREAESNASASSKNPGDRMLLWDEIQTRYESQSRKLAQILQTHLLEPRHFPAGRIQEAPIAVLKGADMPAVLVEIGYLTNPTTEKALKDPDVLFDIATRFAKAIDDYFYGH